MDGETLLIVDDDEGIRTQLALAFSGELNCLLAGTADEALELVRLEKPDVVALDITLSPYEGAVDGLSLLTDILAVDSTTKVIMVTGDTDTSSALSAISRGAFDYYQKPIKLDELRVIVSRALYIQKLERENLRLAEALAHASPSPELLGDSSPMREVFRMIRTVAPSDYSVLITGESGTGKELAAHAIHFASPRAAGPFIPINCSAIPDKLLESELFGHEKGAFTDAVSQKRGKFELASEGTLFLDEVGELPIQLQVKLLRFLQDRKIERLGSTQTIEIDTRVISATNRSLEELVKTGEFREDLFYRISVINIHMPPLRQRIDDILFLANTFLKVTAYEQNRADLRLSSNAEAALLRYPWPGNVRELENKIRRAVLLSNGKSIKALDLGLDTAASEAPDLATARDAAEKIAIVDALTRNQGTVSKTAKALGVSRTTLYGLLRKHGIQQEQ